MDVQTITAALGAAMVVGGPVMAWLMRIERRMTRLETLVGVLVHGKRGAMLQPAGDDS